MSTSHHPQANIHTSHPQYVEQHYVGHPSQGYQQAPVTTSEVYHQGYQQAPVVHSQVIHQQPEVISLNSAPVHKGATSSQVDQSHLTASTIKFDDDSRYRTHAEEMHGYGRNNTKARYGSENRVYNNRFHKDLRNIIVSGKSTSSEYRNDTNCALM